MSNEIDLIYFGVEDATLIAPKKTVNRVGYCDNECCFKHKYDTDDIGDPITIWWFFSTVIKAKDNCDWCGHFLMWSTDQDESLQEKLHDKVTRGHVPITSRIREISIKRFILDHRKRQAKVSVVKPKVEKKVVTPLTLDPTVVIEFGEQLSFKL